MSEEKTTAKAELQAWLDDENREYRAGCDLFNRFSNNRSLQLYFTRKENMSKLVYELGKIAAREVVEEPKQAVQQLVKAVTAAKNTVKLNPERTHVSTDGKVKRENLPEVLQALFDKNTEDYKLMRAVHEKLKLAATDKNRSVFRKQLAEYDDAIAARWAAIDKYVETGELPKKKPAPPGTLSVQEVQAHRTTISRSLTALEEKELSETSKEKIVAKLKERYETLIAGGQTVSDETLEKLKKHGIFEPRIYAGASYSDRNNAPVKVP